MQFRFRCYRTPELIVERTKAGLAAARARGRHGGRPYKMTPAKLRLARAAMGQPETKISELCAEIGVSRQTLYRFVSPTGDLREDGRRLLSVARSPKPPNNPPAVTRRLSPTHPNAPQAP